MVVKMFKPNMSLTIAFIPLKYHIQELRVCMGWLT